MAPPLAQPTLVGLSGPANGETFPLTQAEVHVGRDESNEICLADPAVSRRHCVCVQGASGWTLRDLGSSNGTFVNNIAASERELANGDHIGVGTSVLLFVSGVRAEVLVGQLEDGKPGVDSHTVDIAATQYLQRASEPAAPRVERNLRALLAMSTAINAVQSEHELHSELLRVVRELTPANQAAIVVIDPETGLTVRAGTAAGSRPASVSREAVTRVMQERIGIQWHDAQSGMAYLCAPLAAATTVLGAIFIAASGAAGVLDEEHLQLVTALGRIAAIPLENLRRTAALREETERLRADVRLQHNMIGDSEPMQRVYERINLVAPADTTVLIMGETGSGKELAARAIHTGSPRARRPFIALNCAAIPETLLEDELFGHERGAFTGAVTFKAGKLETAQGGTLFLDEIGEMSPALQSKLLRVLEQREFERLGGTRTIKADIRIVSATNRTLSAEVSAGRFRSDLFFRLNVVSIPMPPLRERREDIPLLARYFLNHFSKKATRRITGISSAALSCLSAYAWPGNARELENAIERATVLGSTPEILPCDLPEEVIEALPAAGGSVDGLGLHEAVVDTRRRAILAAFQRAAGSYVATARLLGVHPNYLHRLVTKLELRTTLEKSLKG